jgi:hypothetical protein
MCAQMIGFSKTKLMQVESILKPFWILIYSQNSDLQRFECTKFVHNTSLKFSGSIMIYNSIGN